MRKISIPATAANMGPGFDCMGVALSLYNTISFSFMDKGLIIELPQKDEQSIPKDARNLIYRVFCNTLHEHGITPPGVHFSQTNDIPPVRGLGSSAACVVGGVLMADAYMDGALSFNEKLELCAAEDGHPDNVLPALIGGITVGCMEGRSVYYQKLPPPKNLCCAAIIPPFPLPTKTAREALPEMVSHKDAVFNLSRAALLAASLSLGNLDTLAQATKDKLHQPYREKLIPGYYEMTELAVSCGAIATCISGAGPTILAFIDVSGGTSAKAFKQRFQSELDATQSLWQVMPLDIDTVGAYISD